MTNRIKITLFAAAIVAIMATTSWKHESTSVTASEPTPPKPQRTVASVKETVKAPTRRPAAKALTKDQKNLFSLMENKQWGAILDYLAKGGSPHVRDEEGKSLLDWASMYGQLDVMVALIKAGADVNSQDNEGRTPLMSAAAQDHATAIELLYSKGAALEIKNDVGQTALLVAVENSHESLVSVFAKNGALLDQTFGDNQFNAYLLASNNGDTSMMDKLIDVNPNFVKSKDRQGRTAAHWTCADGDIKSAAAIIRHGGRLDEKDSSGRTAFTYGTENGSNACVAFAEEAGLRDYL